MSRSRKNSCASILNRLLLPQFRLKVAPFKKNLPWNRFPCVESKVTSILDLVFTRSRMKRTAESKKNWLMIREASRRKPNKDRRNMFNLLSHLNRFLKTFDLISCWLGRAWSFGRRLVIRYATNSMNEQDAAAIASKKTARAAENGIMQTSAINMNNTSTENLHTIRFYLINAHTY